MLVWPWFIRIFGYLPLSHLPCLGIFCRATLMNEKPYFTPGRFIADCPLHSPKRPFRFRLMTDIPRCLRPAHNRSFIQFRVTACSVSVDRLQG